MTDVLRGMKMSQCELRFHSPNPGTHVHSFLEATLNFIHSH